MQFGGSDCNRTFLENVFFLLFIYYFNDIKPHCRSVNIEKVLNSYKILNLEFVKSPVWCVLLFFMVSCGEL